LISPCPTKTALRPYRAYFDSEPRQPKSVTVVAMALSPARTIAFRILLDVEHGGYASDLLYTAARELDSRDAGLAEEIVFGTLRFQSQLDFLIRHYSGRPAAKLDPEVRIVLRMGIYQLRYLDRIPAHA